MNNKYHFNRRNLIEKIESALSKKDSSKSLKKNLLPILKKWLTVTGSTLRPRSIEEKGLIAKKLYKKVWPLIEKKVVLPQIYGSYNLKDANKAHTLVESSQHIGKIILTI